MNRFTTVALAVVVLTTGLVTSAYAADITPPAWRGTGLFTLQDWEFNSSGLIAPDGPLPTVNPGSPMLSSTQDVTWIGLTGGDYGYVGDPGFGGIGFDIPNIPDFEPYKLIRVQISGEWQPNQWPSADSFSVIDSDAVSNIFFEGFEETVPGSHIWWDYRIEPNPDHEWIGISIPWGTVVSHVVIDTTSIPEPGSLALLGLGAGVLLRRRG